MASREDDRQPSAISSPKQVRDGHNRRQRVRRNSTEDRTEHSPAGAIGKGVAVEYVVIIEKGEEGYGAYVPDLPGCVAAADTIDEVRKLIRETIPLHLELMRERGEAIPPPTSQAETVLIA